MPSSIMKPLVLAFLLSASLSICAAEPAGSPGYYDLLKRWATRPIAEIQADADRGDPVAQFYYGKLLVTGRSVARDQERGLALIRRAAAQDNAEAMAELGERHLRGDGLPENPDEALRLARASAARSNAAGLHLLGTLQATGIGMPADAGAALKIYQQAAAAGSPVAMRTIARAHLEGRHGLKPDAAEANRWYLRAAEAGYPKAMNAYGYSLLTGRGIAADRDAAVKWFLRTASAGDSDGLRNMAGKVEVEPRVLLQAWRDAARFGDAEAQYHLARLLASGEAEPQGPEETPHRLLQAAAEGEHVEAALMLGDRYRWGYGGPRDLVAASRWFLHGASFVGDLGDESAKRRISSASQDPADPGGLNNWFREGDWKARRTGRNDAALADVMDRYLRAATGRDADAMREIARFYQRGIHAPVDPVEAAAWLLRARQANPAATAAEAETALRSLSPAQQQQANDRVRHLIKRTL
ncbi:MAG: hypothetical protein WCS99_16325 [Limisphaerales bacterium]